PVLLLRAMMADVVDEDRVKTGAGRAGLFFGMLMTTSKVGQALGPACYGALAAFSFDPKLGAANTPEAMNALTLIFSGVPCVLNLLTALALNNYPLDAARQHALREQIERSEV